MYCPKCGRERLSDETTYCSGCGFQMSQIEPFLDTPIKRRKKRSRLRRGLMQSYILLAVAVFFFGLGLVTFGTPALRGWWSSLFSLGSIVVLVLGVFRLVYALLFESELTGPHDDQYEVEAVHNAEPKLIDGRSVVPIQDLFHPTGATTNDLKPLVDTVTDPTTKHLQREEK